VASAVDERVKGEIQRVFGLGGAGVKRTFFPHRSNDIPDQAELTVVVLGPETPASDPATRALMTAFTTENGASSRTFKSALIWVASDTSGSLQDDARRLIAWEDIEADADELKLDDKQRIQLAEHKKRAARDLLESVWRTYKYVFLLAEDNSLQKIDLGLVHSSAAASPVDLILQRLKVGDMVVDGVSPNLLLRYWPPALPEWATKFVRDAFYASPKFPRLLKSQAVRETIAKGVSGKMIAYVGKRSDGSYEPFWFGRPTEPEEIELNDSVFIITAEQAEADQKKLEMAAQPTPRCDDDGHGGNDIPIPLRGPQQHDAGDNATSSADMGSRAPQPGQLSFNEVNSIKWMGEIPAQKWMNFYTRVLSRFATGTGMQLTLTVTITPPGGIEATKLNEVRTALRELGLCEDLWVEPKD